MIDISRHMSVFNAEDFDKRVDVIGCGAVGSHIVLMLTKLGIQNVHVWDFDEVEEHNIANQVFGLPHIGMPKVDAAHRLMKGLTGIEIQAHNKEVGGDEDLGNVVFIATDTMKSRKEIWDKAVKYKATEALIECRMGADNARIYLVNPMDPTHVKKYEGSLSYDDDESEESLCGSRTTVGPTAIHTACNAVWQMIRWYNNKSGKEGCDEEPENELLTSVNPQQAIAFKFKK